MGSAPPPQLLEQYGLGRFAPKPVSTPLTRGIPGLGGMPVPAGGAVPSPVMGGGLGAGMQLPQVMPWQIPQIQQQAQAPPGAMPFIRSQAMQQVLNPLMQPNYGLPIIPAQGGQMTIPRPIKGGSRGI